MGDGNRATIDSAVRSLAIALAIGLLPVTLAAQEGPSGKVKAKSVPAAPIAVLLEDNAAALAPLLDNSGGKDGSVAFANERTHFAGTSSLSVTPFQRFRLRVPGWNYRVVEQPEPGAFRYLRFAWKRTEGAGIMLQLCTDGRSWKRYYAGDISDATRRWGPMIRVAEQVPRQWQLVTRDLLVDHGACTITGINFTALEGPGTAYFDHIYLARSIEDLDRITEPLKNIVDAPEPSPPAPTEPAAPPRSLAVLVFSSAILIVLIVGVVFAIVRTSQRRKPSEKGE